MAKRKKKVQSPMLRAFLFDFDGTLADTEPLHYEAFAEVLSRRGMDLSFERYGERYLGLGTDREALGQAIVDFGRAELAPELDRLLAEKTAAMVRRIGEAELCRGTRPFLAEAAKRGPLGIVSGAIRSEVEAVLEREGLRGAFRVLVAAEDIKRGKPDPEGYRLGADRLRTLVPDLAPSACLAFEDSPNGVAAARAAGLRVVAFTRSRPASELSAADLVVSTFDDLDWETLVSL